MFGNDEGDGGGRVAASWLHAVFAETASVVRFFSRLPLPRLGPSDDPLAVPDFSRAARVVPIAGAAVALPSGLLVLLLSVSAVPPLAQAIVAVLVLVCVTGALHEDGLADTADGFFGGASPERRLEIMKDSRIGTFGAVALIAGLLLRAVLLGALIERFGAAAGAASLLAGEAASRTAMTWLWQALPPARPGGLGAICGTPKAGAVRVAAAIALAICIPLIFLLSPASVAFGLLLLALATLFMIRLASARIGGQTGDVLGATQQLASVAFLLGLTSVA